MLRQLQYLAVVDALDREPEAVSSAHWGDVPTSSADATLLDAMLKLLSSNAPALSVQNTENGHDRLGFVTLASINREVTRAQQNKQQSNVVPQAENTTR